MDQDSKPLAPSCGTKHGFVPKGNLKVGGFPLVSLQKRAQTGRQKETPALSCSFQMLGPKQTMLRRDLQICQPQAHSFCAIDHRARARGLVPLRQVVSNFWKLICPGLSGETHLDLFIHRITDPHPELNIIRTLGPPRPPPLGSSICSIYFSQANQGNCTRGPASMDVDQPATQKGLPRRFA